MRQEQNNSIDLLLRQLGQQEDVSLSGLDEQHLDADELSSYVANGLPSKTRARYLQHLADCSTCRKMVAQLSAAEGVVTVQQPATVAGPSGLKSFLASLFSPMVLRYAVPALGVIVITVVGIVMLRQERHESATNSVAQVTNTDQNKSVSESERPSSTPQATQKPKAAPPVAVTTEDAPAAAKAAPAEEADREQERQPEAEKKTAPAADQDIAAREVQSLSKAEAKAGEEPKKAKQQTDEVAAAPPPAAAPGNKAPEPQRAKDSAGTGTGGVATVAGSGPSRQETSRARRDETTGSFAYLPTRTVAGREFAKRGDVWIDVAYNASQETTTIRRGTEQYRTLIAGEPAIQTIAEDLKSEFVVVWKGRAYRIR